MQIAVPSFYCTNIFDMHSRERWDFRSSQHSPPCISASLQTFALQHSTSSSTNSRQRIVLGERKKGRLVVAFWWVFVWILFNCNSTRPWHAMFLHAPPPWSTKPNTPCRTSLRQKSNRKKMKQDNLPLPWWVLHFFIRSNIELASAVPDLPSSATPAPLHKLQPPCPMPPNPPAKI